MKNYKYFGVMLDCSRNGVLNVPTVKRMINYLEKMGYNAIELYTEDTYEINDEPYFGYMRGRYTKKEIQEIDSYAKSHGIELIPCIQTLAHLNCIFKNSVYREVQDFGDILLAENEKTYALIEKMFKSIASSFTSRNINIGMDEAQMLGLGKYLANNGYHNRFEIILKHLNKVMEIAKKYGFTPHIWSDMFFRIHNNNNYYGREIHIPKEIIDKVPEGLELTYWDYYHDNIDDYDSMFAAHKEFNKEIWFAGGAWSWNGFAPLNRYTLHTMRPAMESVIKNGIDKVLITMWGDNGKECSFFSLLPSLYAIRQYADGNFDEQKIKEGFEEIYNVSFDDFMLLDIPNKTGKEKPAAVVEDVSKVLLYSDCFMGVADLEIAKYGEIPYGEYAKSLNAAADRAGEFAYLFKSMASLCSVLEIKYDLGIRTRSAYKENDWRTLAVMSKEDYSVLPGRIKNFYENLKITWFKENKAFGWEVQDARFGGLINRINCCAERIKSFLYKEIDCIEELEEDILPCDSGLQINSYIDLVTRSVM